jgi:hypothetical protein
MSKFNVKDNRRVTAAGPIVAESTPTGVTHEGGAGFAHDAKSELFLLAVSNFVGEKTFYEKAGDRDARYERLVGEVAVADPGWTLDFLRWLRADANMRSASLVGAVEAVRARIAAKAFGGNRQMVDAVLLRADEPGEVLAYWTSRHGRSVPLPVKNGVADAAVRLYSERNLLKYDTDSHGYRFADVIELVRPKPKDDRQSALFRFAIDRRHGRDGEPPEALSMVRNNAQLRRIAAERPGALLSASNLREAGMTWEDVLSLVGAKLDKARLWEALIPSLGYMAAIRNLRNMDEAGVSDEAAGQLAARLADPAQVAKSRQFPFRFLAAYEQAPSLRWGHALDKALQASLGNLPALPGRSLILVDTSASMSNVGFSAKSKMTPIKAAAVFGVALAAKGEQVDLCGFADGVFEHKVPKGASVLREIDRFAKRTGEVGHGTQIAGSVQRTFRGHDRVFIISDMQTFAGPYGVGVTNVVPHDVPLYGFNLGGYERTAFDAGTKNRHEMGGLTDSTFRIVPLLEAGRAGNWPWLTGDLDADT